MKKCLHLFILLACAILPISCQMEDDINEIFIGKTWYMTGGRLNSQDLNKEVKNFYTEAGKEIYKIAFQDNTFIGTMANGHNFSGRWSVDPKTRDMSLYMTQEPAIDAPFERNVYVVLKGTKYYEGDSNYLILYTDKNNYIRLNNER